MMQTTQISVDITEVSRKLIHVQVKLPVQSDSVAVFTTPLWIPESHRSNGPISSIAGLHFSSARGTPLRCRRYPSVASEYLVEIPAGVDLVHAAFDAIVTRRATRRTLMLCWESVLLHHARQPIGRLAVHASAPVPGVRRDYRPKASPLCRSRHGGVYAGTASDAEQTGKARGEDPGRIRVQALRHVPIPHHAHRP